MLPALYALYKSTKISGKTPAQPDTVPLHPMNHIGQKKLICTNQNREIVIVNLKILQHMICITATVLYSNDIRADLRKCLTNLPGNIIGAALRDIVEIYREVLWKAF